MINPYRFNATPVPPVDTPFIIKVNSSFDKIFTMKTNSSYGYNYNVTIDGVPTYTGLTGDLDIILPNIYTIYTIEISGVYPSFDMRLETADKIIELKQWGTQKWISTSSMFYNCVNMTISATDIPDLSECVNMGNMFRNMPNITQNITDWDVSNVADMNSIFYNVVNFNQDISSWNLTNCTNMSAMFYGCSSFNQNISGWDVSNVINMDYMFQNATSFNQNLSGWCVTNIPTVPSNFGYLATSWTLPKPVWGTCPP